MQVPAVYISNATLKYQNTLLFDHLNFVLPAGLWTCILGPSGIGKSSLLRMIAGISSATVHAQINTSDHTPLNGRISYMAQEDLLMPWNTVLENVLIGARLRGESTNILRQKALSLIKQVGLEFAVNKKPAQLSGGQRQRVALARTLFEDRPVVLMDEPFASLDAITKLKLQDLAAKLLAKRTVMLITHDPLEALRLGDQVYVMSGLPATLSAAPIIPSGKTPRDVTNPELLALQGELLQQLEDAQEIAW